MRKLSEMHQELKHVERDLLGTIRMSLDAYRRKNLANTSAGRKHKAKQRSQRVFINEEINAIERRKTRLESDRYRLIVDIRNYGKIEPQLPEDIKIAVGEEMLPTFIATLSHLASSYTFDNFIIGEPNDSVDIIVKCSKIANLHPVTFVLMVKDPEVKTKKVCSPNHLDVTKAEDWLKLAAKLIVNGQL